MSASMNRQRTALDDYCHCTSLNSCRIAFWLVGFSTRYGRISSAPQLCSVRMTRQSPAWKELQPMSSMRPSRRMIHSGACDTFAAHKITQVSGDVDSSRWIPSLPTIYHIGYTCSCMSSITWKRRLTTSAITDYVSFRTVIGH